MNEPMRWGQALIWGTLIVIGYGRSLGRGIFCFGGPGRRVVGWLKVRVVRGTKVFKNHFQQLARYNQWANARLYAAALELTDELYRKQTGAFFGSLHGTLNHLLLTDRLWLKRITGHGPDVPTRLNAILFEDRKELARARTSEDARILQLVEGYDDAAFAATVTYSNSAGKEFQQPLGDLLLHLFNHQTHHRGQAHTCMSILTGKEPPPLDLLMMQRGGPAPDLAILL
jgi:uncharacterized damage-inducible protein DinB